MSFCTKKQRKATLYNANFLFTAKNVQFNFYLLKENFLGMKCFCELFFANLFLVPLLSFVLLPPGLPPLLPPIFVHQISHNHSEEERD